MLAGEAGEERLLRQARSWLPRFPFDSVDLLIVDEMGKNISGTGLDRKVIGPGSFGTGSLPAGALVKRSRGGQAYWQFVLRGAAGSPHRPVGHVEFMETLGQGGGGHATRLELNTCFCMPDDAPFAISLSAEGA